MELSRSNGHLIGSCRLKAGILAYLIALLTVGYQAFKAARTEPVQALSYE